MGIEIFLIAFAMSIDAFSVSFGVGCKYNTKRHYFRLGWHFGLFQFFMPLIGAFIGKKLYSFSSKLDILAALILFYIAYNMFKESLKSSEEKCFVKDPTKGFSLVVLSIATSMDALGVGLALPLLKGNIFVNAGIIGIVCMAMSVVGVYFGSKSKNFFGNFAEKIGAVVLIAIGMKFLVV
jgi:putative Mn2+ efflux pump MntP